MNTKRLKFRSRGTGMEPNLKNPPKKCGCGNKRRRRLRLCKGCARA